MMNYLPISMALLSLLWLQRENGNTELDNEYPRISFIGRVLNIVACVMIIAIPIVLPARDMYSDYSATKAEVLERGILDDQNASDGDSALICYEKYGLIFSAFSSDPDSISYIDKVNEQYGQWKNLTFPEYAGKVIGSRIESIFTKEEGMPTVAEERQTDGKESATITDTEKQGSSTSTVVVVEKR